MKYFSLAILFSLSLNAAQSLIEPLNTLPEEVTLKIFSYLQRKDLATLTLLSKSLHRKTTRYKEVFKHKIIKHLVQPIKTTSLHGELGTFGFPCLMPYKEIALSPTNQTKLEAFAPQDLRDSAVKYLLKDNPNFFLANDIYYHSIFYHSFQNKGFETHNLADIILEAMETAGLFQGEAYEEEGAAVNKDLIRIALHHKYADYTMYTNKDIPNTTQLLKDTFKKNNKGIRESLCKVMSYIQKNYSWAHNTDTLTPFKVARESDIHHQLETLRAYFAEHQAILILDIDRVDASGLLPTDSCLYGDLFDKTALEHLVISNSRLHLKSIERGFLYCFRKIKSINFVSFETLLTIGCDFMSTCRKLTHINLLRMTGLQRIGHNFLSSCENLHNIDFSGFLALKSIGNNFLSCCESLTGVNFFKLPKLENIGDRFLYNCNKIENVDFSGLESLETIGNYFMQDCESLTRINISKLLALVSIGEFFLVQCKNLNKINFLDFLKLQKLGLGFLYGCKSLTHADFSGLESLETIDDPFMERCLRLEEIIANQNNLVLIQSSVPAYSNTRIIVK